MIITEKKYTVVDGIDEVGNLQVKEVTQVLRDGVPTDFKSYHRKVVHVGDDITNEDIKVKAAASIVWNTATLDNKVATTITKVQAVKAEVEAEIALLQAAIDKKKAKQAEVVVP